MRLLGSVLFLSAVAAAPYNSALACPGKGTFEVVKVRGDAKGKIQEGAIVSKKGRGTVCDGATAYKASTVVTVPFDPKVKGRGCSMQAAGDSSLGLAGKSRGNGC